MAGHLLEKSWRPGGDSNPRSCDERVEHNCGPLCPEHPGDPRDTSLLGWSSAGDDGNALSRTASPSPAGPARLEYTCDVCREIYYGRHPDDRPQGFLCPLCRRVSYHWEDVRERYCPCCGNDSLPKTCEHRQGAEVRS